MRSELELRRELKAIEVQMVSTPHYSAYDVAYGAYMALTWMLKGGPAASIAVDTIDEVKAEQKAKRAGKAAGPK